MNTTDNRTDENSLKSYVNNMSDDTLARWFALLLGESFVAKRCGDNDECISSYSNALNRYVKEVWEDVKYFFDKLQKGEKIEEEAMDNTYRQLSDLIGLRE